MSDRPEQGGRSSGGMLRTPVRRRLLFGSLYLSEGAPIGFVWWALPVELRASGVPVERIALLTSMLTLVWGLKFIWAPMVDLLRGPRFGYRGWILSSQLLMGATILPLAWLDMGSSMFAITALLLAHAVCATVQDVSIDAMAISTIAHEERGRINAWMQVGMLVGRGAFGGLSIWLASHVGQAGLIAALLGSIWWSMALVAFGLPRQAQVAAGVAMPRPEASPAAAAQMRVRAFGERLGAVLRRRATWMGLAIALGAGATFEAAGGLATSMMHDSGYSRATIGGFFGFAVLLCSGAGALGGGWLADRVGHGRVVFGAAIACGVLSALSWSVLSWGAERGGAGPLLALGWLGAMYLAVGALTAATYALLMDLTDPGLGATQFSAYMGATNLCESGSMLAASRLLPVGGYGLSVAAPVAVGLIGAALALRVRTGGDRDSRRMSDTPVPDGRPNPRA